MKVLHVSPGVSARIGGSAMMALDSARPLRSVGVETALFAPDLAVGAQARRYPTVANGDLGNSAEHARLFRTRPPRRLVCSPSLYRALAREVAEYDVVHIHNLWTLPQFSAYREARKQDVPYVVAPCGALDPLRRGRNRQAKWLSNFLWQQKMLDRAALIHFKSRGEAERAADLLPSGASTAVVPNGIAWDKFQSLPSGKRFRSERLDSHDGPVVMTLGRISWEKRLDLLIRAFARLAPASPDALLAIVGPDDEDLASRLNALAEALGIGKRVRFPGAVQGDEKLEALAAADVWCQCSWFESFGLAVIEALAAGRPTVITAGVQISDEIQAAGAGIVAPDTPEGIAESILELLNDERRRARLAAEGRRFARAYDWPAVAERLRHMYRRAGS